MLFFLFNVKYQISEIIKLKENLDQIGFDIHTRRYQPGFNPDTLTESLKLKLNGSLLLYINEFLSKIVSGLADKLVLYQ